MAVWRGALIDTPRQAEPAARRVNLWDLTEILLDPNPGATPLRPRAPQNRLFLLQ